MEISLIIIMIYYTLSVKRFTIHSRTMDYFSERFDETKNCENTEKLMMLVENNKDQCIHYTEHGINPNQWLQSCSHRLAKKLVVECSSRKVKHSGNLIYCNDRGSSQCCVTSYSCNNFNSYDWINRGKQYLNDTIKYLKENLVNGLGYKSCHHLEDYDAYACAIDCKKYGESKFAKNCTEHSGLFKCCIRRDAFCDQCKFCCTLPMCTYKDNSTAYDSTPLSPRKKTAFEIFEAPNLLWKNDDFRCLKPNSHKDPNKWRHYDTEEFRAANNKSQLSNVYSYSFNKNMFMYFDQSILNKYTSKNGKRLLKKTYGYDYCSGDNTIEAFPKVGSLNTDCTLQCEKAENEEFANNCRKQNGVFKCCQVRLTFHKYSEVNINLGLTKTKHCQKKNLYKYCDYCCITLLCTKKDKKSGKIVNKLKTKTSRAQKVGGDPQVRYGKRLMGCLEMDMCNSIQTWMYYKTNSEYKNAYTSEEICRLKVDDKYGIRNISIPALNDKRTNKCMKNKKSAEINIKICSTKKLRKKGETDKLIKINKKLAKMRNKRQHYCNEKKSHKSKIKKKKSCRRKRKRTRKRKIRKKNTKRRNGEIYKYSIEDGYTVVKIKI